MYIFSVSARFTQNGSFFSSSDNLSTGSTVLSVGDADPSDPLCSPAFAKDQALAAFPDCLIISAGEDSLRDDTEAFGMRLAKAGVCVTMQRITEAMHGFTTNRTPGWERALDRQYKFFQEHLR